MSFARLTKRNINNNKPKSKPKLKAKTKAGDENNNAHIQDFVQACISKNNAKMLQTLTGFSIGTINNYFNHPKKVSPDTFALIKRIEELIPAGKKNKKTFLTTIPN